MRSVITQLFVLDWPLQRKPEAGRLVTSSTVGPSSVTEAAAAALRVGVLDDYESTQYYEIARPDSRRAVAVLSSRPTGTDRIPGVTAVTDSGCRLHLHSKQIAN